MHIRTGPCRRIGRGLALTALVLATLAPAATAAGHVDVIVVYVDGIANSRATTEAVARQHGADPRWVYEHAIEGFAGTVPEGRLKGLRNDPRVDHVERDQVVTTAAQQLPTGIDRIQADTSASIPIGTADDLRVDVDVAVVDTGIDLDHPDLHVVGSTNCLGHAGGPRWDRAHVCEGTGDDGSGHGTHVAGTIGALDNGVGVVGVAPGARLHGVKVLDDGGSGSWGSVIAGIEWVVAHGGIEVANLSLGGGESAAVDAALATAADAGVALALAAGNESADVEDRGPAGHPDALTVSALADYDGQPGGSASTTPCDRGADDTFATFSNHGDTTGDDVDVIAPGVCILSTVPGGYDDGWSGTSMASPHVAGALALLASSSPPGTPPSALYDTVIGNGNSGWSDPDGFDRDDVREPLLDVSDVVFAPALVGSSDNENGDGSETNEPPTASFSYGCTGLACDFDGSGSSDDGSISRYDWDFGDGSAVAGATASHTYAEGGVYTVTLTVTDDEDATGVATAQVTVTTTDAGGDISLTVAPHKVRGAQQVELAWSGTHEAMDVHRDGILVATGVTANPYIDVTGQKGGGVSYTYTVCEAGSTAVCSNPATATF